MLSVAGRHVVALSVVVAVLVTGLLAGCNNNPYPTDHQDQKVLYQPFLEAPKSLDPAVAYDTVAHEITANVFDSLLEYHYLERPLRLIPGIARAVPKPEPLADGSVVYNFELRSDLSFDEDVCFTLGPGAPRSRKISAHDVVFAIRRIADAAVNSPVAEPFSNLLGFEEFRTALTARRKADPAFARLRSERQYEALGGFAGARALDEHRLAIHIAKPYPQILYWFAQPFATPMPWEAVVYYDGKNGRPHLADHPVSSGPFRVDSYDKQSRIVLTQNPNWYGLKHPEAKAPAATYPEQGSAADAAAGYLLPSAAGKPVPWLERVEYRREKEAIPTFNKFLQGYYDISAIARESFDKVIKDDNLSPEMKELGIHLDKTVTIGVYYIGFNMSDRVVGRANAERSRKLRQAMSLATDVDEYLRIFFNGRGVPAQSLLPPGIFGHDTEYRNPYRTVDVERAKQLLVEAGYPGGVDPATQKPLHMTFDTYDTSAAGRLRYLFWVNQWRRLGLDVEIVATTYNKFQEKVKDGAYQIFTWGWIGDYPDAENFMFLLWSEMARSKNNGPNTANFTDPEFDRLFLSMKALEDGPEKLEILRKMRKILEVERPWIELFFPEDYALSHSWLANVKRPGISLPAVKYYDIDAKARSARRGEWNRPVLWPMFALGLLALGLIVPGVRTYLRERR